MAIPQAEIVGVKITGWEPGRLGVSYSAADGKVYGHEIGEADRPIIDRFEQGGTLAFAADWVRAAWAEIRGPETKKAPPAP